MSLDGYIAGPNGEFDWIDIDPSESAGYFKAFYAQFDTAIMGRKSFELAKGAVAPLTMYVVSRTLPAGKLRDVTVLGADALERIADLREQPQGHLAVGRRRALRQLGRSRGLTYDVQKIRTKRKRAGKRPALA